MQKSWPRDAPLQKSPHRLLNTFLWMHLWIPLGPASSYHFSRKRRQLSIFPEGQVRTKNVHAFARFSQSVYFFFVRTCWPRPQVGDTSRLALPWVGISASPFPLSPRLRAALLHRLRAEGAVLRAGGGHAFRKVAPKILPRATQDAKFLPPRLVWTVGGRIFCKHKPAKQRTRPYQNLNFFGR